MMGETHGHYHIIERIGAGGMGEVYRATDTKLKRDVAIKVLPDEVAQDPARLARFQREAELLASLNHSHIAAIHGLEEAGGQPFLVLELVEGEDLKERLERGAIPVDEALEIAVQVAEALEEAHSKGIVHRDLKPANVKVTPDGKVKVLDFGLAKAWAGDAAEGKASSASMSRSPTLAHSGTQAGVILGTAAYMSPEQARGKPVDKRGDVWAFGVLLWEMLTGRILFAGDTVTDIIAAVVKEEPDLEALPDQTPQVVRWLIARCLRKDPRTRLPDAGAARLDLQEVLAGTAGDAGTEPGGASTGEVRRLARQRSVWAAAAVLSAGLGALLAFVHFTEVPEPRPVAHFVVDTPEELSFPTWAFPAVSPDGRLVAFAGTSADGSRRIWIRRLDSPETRALPGTDGGVQPFWSPDGRWLAFSAFASRDPGDLKKLNLSAGTVHTICPLPREGGVLGSWNGEDTIVFSNGGSTSSLFSVAAAGGEATPLIAHDESREETGHFMPWFLPDGRHFLFDVVSSQEESDGVYVASLDAPDEKRRLLSEGTRVIHVSGHLFFVRDGTLFAQPFDPDRLEVAGVPVPVVEDITHWSAWRDWAPFSISPSRVLAYRTGGGTGDVQLAWVDRTGDTLETIGEPGPYRTLDLSPDERRVAVEVPDAEGQEVDLWVIDVSRGVARRLTSDPGDELNPVWAPDSQEIVFGKDTEGGHVLHRKRLRGGPASPLAGSTRSGSAPEERPQSWSPEGEVLLYTERDGTTVWALALEAGGQAEPALEVGFPLFDAQLSPDGQWLAYSSMETGAWEIYVQPFRREGERVRVSVDGGWLPRWRDDGRELFFQASDGRSFMAVEVREGDAGPVGLPAPLFKLGPVDGSPDSYGVSTDGQRFLVGLPVGGDTPERIHVVTDWTSLLE